MNPFAAPQNDSPAPVDNSSKRRLFAVLGVVELVAGIGFALLSVAGTFYAWSSKDLNWGQFVRAEIFTISASVVCIVAGRALIKGPSRRALYLQIGPAVALIVSVWYRYSTADDRNDAQERARNEIGRRAAEDRQDR
jgi:hypothetical protein